MAELETSIRAVFHRFQFEIGLRIRGFAKTAIAVLASSKTGYLPGRACDDRPEAAQAQKGSDRYGKEGTKVKESQRNRKGDPQL